MRHPLRHDVLIGLPVLTESGTRLGSISCIELDPEQHTVTHYRVKPTNPIRDLVAPDLLIAPAQVVSLDRKAMIVEDARRAPQEASVPASTA